MFKPFRLTAASLVLTALLTPSIMSAGLGLPENMQSPLIPSGGLGIKTSEASVEGANVQRTAPLLAPENSEILRRADGTPIKFIGSIVYGAEGAATATKGIYSFTSAGNDFNMLKSDVDGQFGGVLDGGIYYVNRQAPNPFGVVIYSMAFSMNNWTKLWEKNYGVGFQCLDMTRDPVTGNIYAIIPNEVRDRYILARLNYDSGKAKVVGEFEYSLHVLAADATGQLYGIGVNGILYKIDKNTAAMTKVGSTGLTPQYLASATIDPVTGKMYWTLCNSGGSGLIEVDTSTGASRVVAVFPNGEEVTGLEILGYAPKSPAMPENLSTTLGLESFDGNVSFKVPAKCYDGTTLSGSVSYSIRFNGQEIANGTSTAGADVTKKVTVPSAGKAILSVTLSNDAGAGPEAAVMRDFVGSVIPPYVNHFNNDVEFSEFTVVDANADNITWAYAPSLRAPYCQYNSNKAMDDWMMSPPLYLEAGKTYLFSVNARTYLTTPVTAGVDYETIEIRMGNRAVPAAMTQTLVSKRNLQNSTTVHNLSSVITPTTTGTYYIGIHGCSPKDAFWLVWDDFVLEGGFAVGAPTKPLDLTVTPAADGSMKAEVKFTSPLKRYKESDVPLVMTKIEVYRNETELVKVFENPTANTQMSFVDEVPSVASYTYTVRGFNDMGGGVEARSAAVEIGTSRPAAPSDVSITETSTPGQVRIKWSKVSKDLYGKDLDPAKVKYMVGLNNGVTLDIFADDLNETEYTMQAATANEAKFVQYHIYGKTLGGRGAGASTRQIPVGASLPGGNYQESFANGYLTNPIGVEAAGGSWSIFTEESGISASDGDNGFIGFMASSQNGYGTMSTTKLNLKKALDTPILKFNVYKVVGNNGDNENTTSVMVSDPYTGVVDTVYSVINKNLPNTGWNEITVPLPKTKGKEVILHFNHVAKTYGGNLLDNIRLTANSGVNDLFNSTTPEVTGLINAIRVTGASGLTAEVIDMSGVKVATFMCGDETVMPMGKGVYAVRLNDAVYKVVVK